MRTIFSCLRWLVLTVVVAWGGGIALPTTWDPQETPAPPAEAPRTDDASEEEAVALLERLEAAHAKVDVFTSPLTYRKEYALEGDFETRIGEVALRGHGAEREIVLVFERVIDADGHGTDELRYHVYRDGWWTEVDPKRRRVVARQIQEAGSTRDPFDLGEGPLPLPLGQKADRVRGRFEVSIGSKPEDALLRGIKDPLVLHLVPRKGTPAGEDIESIDLLFERESLLPVGVLVSDVSGDRTTAWMRKPSASDEDGSFSGRAGEASELIQRAKTDSTWTFVRKPLAPTRIGESF